MHELKQYLPPKAVFTHFGENVITLKNYYRSEKSSEELNLKVNRAALEIFSALLIGAAMLTGAVILYSTLTTGVLASIIAAVCLYVVGRDFFAMADKRVELKILDTNPPGMINALRGNWHGQLSEEQTQQILDATIAKPFWSLFFKSSTLNPNEINL